MSEPRVGRILKDFAPGAGNPRNSEGAFLKRKDGTLLFVFSRFVGTSDRDHATANIAAVRSSDGGETWSEPMPLGADNPAGGPVRNKPIRLADGRMLAPNSDESAEAWLPRVDESTDGGRTFRRLAPIPLNRTDEAAPDFMPGIGAIQPTLWESAPGRVHALLRTQAGRVYRSDSEDGGRTWSTAYPTALPNNNSGIDLANAGDALYLALNPTTGTWGPRTPLVVMKSTDNGETFADFATLADDPIDDRHGREGQFCYPAIVARGGRLHITYTHNRKSIAYAEIRLREGRE